MKKILTIIIVVVALQLGVASVALASGGTYHKVHYGDTLFSIGRQYGVNAYRIAEANGLYNPNHIYAGQVLYIPSDGCDYGCDNGGYQDGGTRHRIRYGETLFSIGRQYGVNPYHIAQANNLYNPNYIYAGQVLYIPSDGGYGYGRRDASWQNGCNTGCGNNNWQGDCNTGCGNNYWQGDCKTGCGGSYGYDYTGYYYNYGNQRYSYTCGYYYNCW